MAPLPRFGSSAGTDAGRLVPRFGSSIDADSGRLDRLAEIYADESRRADCDRLQPGRRALAALRAFEENGAIVSVYVSAEEFVQWAAAVASDQEIVSATLRQIYPFFGYCGDAVAERFVEYGASILIPDGFDAKRLNGCVLLCARLDPDLFDAEASSVLGWDGSARDVFSAEYRLDRRWSLYGEVESAGGVHAVWAGAGRVSRWPVTLSLWGSAARLGFRTPVFFSREDLVRACSGGIFDGFGGL